MGGRPPGRGRALLTAAMTAAEEKSPVSLETAEVPVGHAAAERLFRSAGWQPRSRHRCLLRRADARTVEPRSPLRRRRVLLRAGFAAVADAVVFRWSPHAEGAT